MEKGLDLHDKLDPAVTTEESDKARESHASFLSHHRGQCVSFGDTKYCPIEKPYPKKSFEKGARSAKLL